MSKISEAISNNKIIKVLKEVTVESTRGFLTFLSNSDATENIQFDAVLVKADANVSNLGAKLFGDKATKGGKGKEVDSSFPQADVSYKEALDVTKRRAEEIANANKNREIKNPEKGQKIR